MERMEKQTAVEWLVEQVFMGNTNQWQLEIDQALEMEKEQLIDAYDNTNSMAMNGEQYYNETFKSE